MANHDHGIHTWILWELTLTQPGDDPSEFPPWWWSMRFQTNTRKTRSEMVDRCWGGPHHIWNRMDIHILVYHTFYPEIVGYQMRPHFWISLIISSRNHTWLVDSPDNPRHDHQRLPQMVGPGPRWDSHLPLGLLVWNHSDFGDDISLCYIILK